MDNNSTVILNADRPRILKATHSALQMAEKMTGIKLKDADRWLESFDGMTKVAWAFMAKDARDHGEKLNEAKVADILDSVATENEIVEAIQAAFEAAFPTTKNAQTAPTTAAE